MDSEKYTYATNHNNLVYTFHSLGINGIILKVVVYEKIEDGFYNLAFGDFDEETGEISDKAVSNNGDTIKVLATVIQTIRDFFVAYPESSILIRGSTTTRTRLYQKIIKDNIATITTEFQVFALKQYEDDYEPFNARVEYQEFKIYKKL